MKRLVSIGRSNNREAWPVTIFLLTLSILVFECRMMFGAERNPLQPRVPSKEIQAVQNWKPPFGSTRNASSDTVSAGKQIYEDQTKGACYTCHGKSGKADGINAKLFSISPRDFTNCSFHAARTDGELFWILKNGSRDTGMMPMVLPKGLLTEEEAWSVLAYERRFCKDWSQ